LLQTNTKAHTAVLLTNIFFATNYSMVKYISPALVGPYGLNIWLLGKTPIGIQKKHLPRFLLCGFTGVAANQMLFIKGLTMTSTIHASLLMLCTPLLITIFAFWILKEKITLFKATGLALGIGGAVLLIISKEKAGNNTASLTGDILVILNAIFYTIYFMLVKPLMKAYPPLHVIRWVFTFGFIMILPFGWMQFSSVNWQQFELSHFASLAFIVVCGTFLAYFFTVYGLQHLGAGVTGAYIYTQPIFAAVVATLILHEQFTLQKILAGGMIFTGVFLVSRKTAVNVKAEQG
jgi:drug/metabolite transporter (DMT)-like permease